MNAAFPSSLQSDHLFLLVGTNPLPNYIAAILLARSKATIYLLHSADSAVANTALLAEFLDEQLSLKFEALNERPAAKEEQPRYQITIARENCVIDASDGPAIENKVGSLLEPLGADAAIGLNYTGGTKPMAVHSHRVVAATLSDGVSPKFPKAILSYLDPRDLSMHFDHLAHPVPVESPVSVTLAEVAALHGYRLKTDELETEPKSPSLARAIARVNSTANGYKAWRNWAFPQPDTDRPTPAKGEKAWREWVGSGAPTELPAADGPLALVREKMDRLCGGEATPEKLAHVLGCKEGQFRSCKNWFQGTWLEEVVLAAVKEAQPQFGFTSFGKSPKLVPGQRLSEVLETRYPHYRDPDQRDSRDFELDVAVMIGYQLFVFSCVASAEAGNTKYHLLEAWVRARQLGGDEARVALVSCVGNTEPLLAEIQRDWQAGSQIKVFGRQHLNALPDEIAGWFQQETNRRR